MDQTGPGIYLTGQKQLLANCNITHKAKPDLENKGDFRLNGTRPECCILRATE